MEASKQYHGSMQVAVEVASSRSKEHAGKQQIIATEPADGSTGSGLVATIQQLYKLLYKSCVEAKVL